MTDDDQPAWIERVVSIAGALGFNRVRMRWKLIRWSRERRKHANRREQAVAHIKYEHALCPECGAVNARDEETCTRCGATMHSRARELLGRLGLGGISSTIALALIIVGCYVRTALAGHDWYSIPTDVLVRHGANLPRGVADDQWWRYLTATLLHVGMWHLAFNLLALAVVGPHVERNYGRLGMLFLFVLTGALASIGSQLTGMWGAGASGALMGLMGAIAGAGHRSGTTIGKQERNAMLRWAAYTIVFGFAIGADNHAHVAGFVVGAIFGLLVPTEARTPRWVKRAIQILGALSLVAIVGAAALVMSPPTAPALFPPRETAGRAIFDDVMACRIAQQTHLASGEDGDESTCAHIDEVRRDCHAQVPAFLDSAERRATCVMLERIDRASMD